MAGSHFLTPSSNYNSASTRLTSYSTLHDFNMARILSILIATLAVVSPVTPAVQAVPCTPDLLYCGRSLKRHNYPGSENFGSDTLYLCKINHTLVRLVTCKRRCVDVDGGGGVNDSCR
ncbi:hypothetical protein E4U32_007462 [Claviceps aff. humidiphila group G2b]|nr:hypothetical protein E4U32_007462 [Claviceps aff. humidiphila group G2b]